MPVPVEINFVDEFFCESQICVIDFYLSTTLQDLRERIWEEIKLEKGINQIKSIYYTHFYVQFWSNCEGCSVSEQLEESSVNKIKEFCISTFQKFNQSSSNGESLKETRFSIIASLAKEVQFWPEFTSPFDFYAFGEIRGFAPKTLRELEMIKYSAAFRRKTLWYDRIKDPKALHTLKFEALQQGFTENQTNYILQELDYYASIRDQEKCIQVSDIDGLWNSDTLIDPALQTDLLDCIEQLEKLSKSSRDLNVDTSNQVLDLVDPSLYPLIFGKTRTILEQFETVESLNHSGGGEILSFKNPNTKKFVEDFLLSKTFSWLPAEFKVNENGKVKICSYINNLHPVKSADLYSALEKIFSKFVPLFENVLNDLAFRVNGPPRIQIHGSWYQEEPPIFLEDNFNQQYFEWKQSRPISIPDAPENYAEPKPFPFDKKICLNGTNLQVIVKLSSVVLTPQNPKFFGGVWHVDGMQNENIVATGVYYYDVKNVTESEVAFRQSVLSPHYDGNDHRGVEAVYGLKNQAPLNQVLGTVQITKNRCLVYPNIFQHCIQPFELKDATKVGHCKIIVFHWVDPGKRIVSTFTVPPQQRNWFVEELLEIPPFDSLPWEINEQILKFLDWPLTLSMANSFKKDLTQERNYFILKDNEKHFERLFWLPEH